MSIMKLLVMEVVILDCQSSCYLIHLIYYLSYFHFAPINLDYLPVIIHLLNITVAISIFHIAVIFKCQAIDHLATV